MVKELTFTTMVKKIKYFLFIIGKLAFIVPIFEAGGRMGGAGLGMSIIFGYFLIKGTISAFKYNYQK